VQRTAESQNLEIRETLWKYESAIEHHRGEVSKLRREMLLSPAWSIASMLDEQAYSDISERLGRDAVENAGRKIALAILDDVWADYLANVASLKDGIHWVSWGGRDPLHTFLTAVQDIYADFHQCLRDEIAHAFETAEVRDGAVHFEDAARLAPGATWTYLTTDQPFGTLAERAMKGLRRKFSGS
jgi:preprotein translocase subunit SecA